MNSGTLSNLCALAAVIVAVVLFGCLDADPLAPGGKSADVHVELVYLTGSGSSKLLEIDSIRIALHDITDDPWTGEPEQFALAAEETAPTRVNNATGVHYLGELRVELSDQRIYRAIAYISLAGEGGDFEGERTITLSPNDQASITLVMTDAGEIASGSFDLAVPKTIGSPGDTVDIPIVLVNADSLGGIQFQLRFDGDILNTVMGIKVDPASRLYIGGGEDDADRIYGHFASTDSSARVVVVDLPVGGVPSEPLRPIVPGSDLLLFLVVTLNESLSNLPDTMDLLLSDVFFSTPSGSSDIAVSEPTGGVLIITD